jgi:hypothetical protein
MRTFFLTSILALLIAGPAFSQTLSSSPCSDPAMKPTGDTVKTTVSVSGGSVGVTGTGTSTGNDKEKDKKNGHIIDTGRKTKNNGQFSWEICIWRNESTGQTSYSIRSESISYTGDGTVINGMTTPEIFDLLAQTSVAQLVAQGSIPCNPDCSTAQATAMLFTTACVQRSGSGASTQFLPCDALSCCMRTYSVCCPYGPGNPVIQLLSSQSSGCTSTNVACETTCPG